MIVQHNMAALNTNRQLGVSGTNLSKATEKLSSGYRINRAGDDAAGLSISEKMRGQIRGLDRASQNAEDGVSLIQTAEGAMNEIHSILQRMRELTVQAANDTNVADDRTAISTEQSQLTEEIKRISSQTQFNTQKLLNGFSGYFQVGANSEQSIKVDITDLSGLGDGAAAAMDSYANATAYLETLDNDIKTVSTQRSNLGAIQNRLEHTILNADNTSENLQSAESRIRDVDMADEMVTYSKNNIVQQAAQSMLAQANQSTQGVLSLLR